MYSVSVARLSLLEVLANKSRCGRAPSVLQPLPAVRREELAIGAIGMLSDGNAELVLQFVRHLLDDGDGPSG